MLENVIKFIIKILDINPAQYKKLRNYWVSDIKLRDKDFKVILDAILNLLEDISEGKEDKEIRIKREFKNSEILRIRSF